MMRDVWDAVALRPLRLLVRYWPQLAACYLLGLFLRHGTIELAAWAGYDNTWWASVIMPLAGMARLGSYVAMFLVLRPALPALVPTPGPAKSRVDIFSTVVVPFFAIYLAWQMFREDWIAFETRALDYRVTDSMVAVMSGEKPTLDPGSLPVGTTTWLLIWAALVLRWALSRVKDRLPAPMVVVRIYIDALWVFLVLSFSVNRGLTWLLNPTEWISQRRIIVWFNDTRAELFARFAPLEKAWDGASWLIRTAFGEVTVPLLWLAVAGIVYAVGVTADWRSVVRRVGGRRADDVLDRSVNAQTAIRGRWSKLPGYLRDRGREQAVSQLGRFKPITDAGRVILHAGVPALALYVLLYVVLAWLDRSGSYYGVDLGDGYLLRGLAWVVGPHPLPFWAAYQSMLSMAAHVVIEPLRICLIASTFAYCVENVVRSAPATTPTAP